MEFFVGLHQPSDAKHVEASAFISVNRLRDRKSGFQVGRWIMDSGAFSTIFTHGGYPEMPETYAAEIKRWACNGELLAAVSQDYMCEASMLAITGLTIAEHQRLTIERYDAITACDTGGVYIMPVLQGYAPADYVSHIRQYGSRLPHGAWVGVGSVCKRNGDPAAIEEVLLAVKRERPDLRLHGFGLKTTALGSELVRTLLHTADSMAWSYSARKKAHAMRKSVESAKAKGFSSATKIPSANDWREAARFAARIDSMPVQLSMLDALV